MTNETTLIVETEPPIMMTCADGVGIEKGTLLQLADPLTASAQSGANDVIAGIAAEEKIASDGKTKIAVYRRGIFKGLCGDVGNIAVGVAIDTHASTGATNELASAPAGASQIVGVSFEAAADEDTFLFELNPTHQT